MRGTIQSDAEPRNLPYGDFLDRRRQGNAGTGLVLDQPGPLFDFQRSLVSWALDRGRAAIFADCGLGKTAMELVWADHVARATGRPTLILTPLAVGPQTVREGEKFGIPVARSQDGLLTYPITVTNYERLSHFDPTMVGGVVCDESSILKNFEGVYRQQVTDFMRKVPYRLLATATAAPNDYIELGTSSESLGHLGYVDMLSKFFKNDLNNVALKRLYGTAPAWRLKHHAALPFWRWVATWARACRHPSDLGFADGGFRLPPIEIQEHVIVPDEPPEGMLFTLPATTLEDQRIERRRTLNDRCQRAAALVNAHRESAVVWCHTNEEGHRLAALIDDAVQVSGHDSDDMKERRFTDFAEGRVRVLITKPKIGAWGLNWQHCRHVVYFPSHSFEAYYQAVRRCWRFGQTGTVRVDIVLTEGERRVMENLRGKADKATTMFGHLVREMNHATALVGRPISPLVEQVPSWL